MYSSVSVDGFVADENDQPGPLFDWLSSGDVPLDESGELKVSQTSYDYTRPYWDQIGATIVGRPEDIPARQRHGCADRRPVRRVSVQSHITWPLRGYPPALSSGGYLSRQRSS